MTRVRDSLLVLSVLLFIAINFCTRVVGNIDRSQCCNTTNTTSNTTSNTTNTTSNTTSPEIGRSAAVQTVSSVIRTTVIALTYNRISVAYHTQYYHRQDDASLLAHESNDNFPSNIGADGVQFLMLPFSAFMLAINLWKLLASAFHHSKHMARAYGMLTGHYLLILCRKFSYQSEVHIPKQLQLCVFGEVITESLRRLLLLSYTRILMCATAVVLQEPEATLRSRQFVTMWLLRLMQRQQSQQQQQQQEEGHQSLYIAHSVQQQKQNHPNCSEHCGNMFQKQSESYTFSRNQQCQQLQQPKEQIYKLLLLQHHLAIVSLFFVAELQYRARGISATAVKTRTALATNLSIYILCKQNYRRNKHRRRRKLQCIARYILWMSARRHLIRVLWQKLVIRRQKLGNESISATRSKPAVSAEQPCNARRMCVDRFFHIGESVSNDCCSKTSCSSDNINYNATACNNCCNYSNNNGKKYKYNKNARCPLNTCSECSCCCYCCCHYCCCCCYCCCYHVNLLTCHYCCCCLCFCCYQQQQQQQQHNNNTTNSSAKTNPKCSRTGFQQHANGATHQQLQYEQYTHKEYQQHKRQQQNVFYQQHTSNCYHRRRRRYFCASYTNWHSYCCCFFKWICWRHHSYIEYIEKIGISAEATLAAVASMRLFFQNYYQKCFHKLLLYLQYLHQHFKSLILLTTPDSKPDCNCTQERCNRRCIRHVASTGHSMERYKRQFGDKDSIVSTAKQSKTSAGIHLDAFKTITRNKPAKITLSRPERVNVTLAKSRMYNLVFRRHWVWLIIGLIWLDGPIIAKGNNSSSSSSPTALNYTPTYDKSDCNTNCTQAAIRISELHSSDIDLPMSTKVLPNHLPTRQTPSGRSASSRDWNDRARGEETRRQSDVVRLESIKRQILSKLGLKKKPNVTHPLPKQFIWDTIYRADGISSVTDFDFNDNHRGREIVSKKTSKLLKYSTSQHKLINRAPRVENRALRAGLRVNFIDVADDVVGELVVSSENMYADDNIGALLDEHFHLHHNQKEPLTQSVKKKIKLNHYSDKGTAKVFNSLNANGEGIKMQTGGTAAASAQSVTDVFHAASLSAHTENDIYEADDYFGSTQEIITFAEQGEMYKKHRLVEFSSPTHRIPEQQLHIRHAEIHIRIEKIYRTVSVAESGRRAPNTKLKLWIFQLLAGDYTQQGFDQVARFCTSLAVKSHELGWQKLDLTETVRYWYERSPPGEKLRLLIDCTGCGQNFMFHLFDVYNRTQTQEEPKRSKNNHNKKKQQQEQRRRSHHHVEATASVANGAVQKFRNLNKYWNSNVTDLTDKQRKNTQRSQQQQQHFSTNYNKYTPLSIRVKSNRNRNNHVYNTHALPRQKKEAAPITQTQIFKEFRHLEDRLNPNRPFLVLHTEPIRARRVRRRVIDCSSALHGQCCKESFYVSFKALGWDDWIIAPRGYFANYCRGDCSGPYRTPDTFQTFHAHFIEEYRKLGLLNGMQPCCAPVKFSSMSLIYYGDDGIIKRDLPKMVVDECGCP